MINRIKSSAANLANWTVCVLFAFACLSSYAQAGKPIASVDSVAALLLRKSIPNERVILTGWRTNGDFGAHRILRHVPDSTTATNLGCVFDSLTNGRYVADDCDGAEINAKWFGATGDGLTDDGVTINAAIDYASTNKIVRIPLGSYLLTNFLVLNTGTKLVGDGIGKTYLLRGGTSAQTNSHLYATIQTPAVFNPYVTNGGHVGSVTCTVTNISLEGFTLTTADGYHPGFGIALFGHQNAKLNNVEITGCTNHWAVTVFGNNTEIRGLQIRNAGWIYRDGIHMLGGDGIAIANCDITSGDDALAFGGGTQLDVSIKNVTVANCVVSSSHGHAVRVAIENASATNAHSGFVISGVVGYAGLQRNGLVYMHSDSTNMTYGINDVTLRGLRLTHGGIAGHGGYAVGAAYGVRMTKMNGVLLDDVNVGQTPFRNFFVENCGRVTLSHCTGGGPQTNFIAQPIYANTVSDLRLIGGSFVNENGIDTDTVTLTAVDKFQAIGTAFGHTLATRPCIGLSGAASGDISLISCTLTNLPGYGMIVSTMPASIVLFNNRFGVNTGIQNANPYQPENVIEAGNIGLSDEFFASDVAANTLSVTNTSATALQSWVSNPGTESRVDFRISGTYPQWYSSPFYLWTDTLSNTTDKYFRLGSLHYNTSEEPVFAIVQQSYNGANWIDYGGSSALGNAATQHRWFLGTNATHTAGTNVMQLTYTSTTNETPLSLLVNGSIVRVGITNVGGANVLYVP